MRRIFTLSLAFLCLSVSKVSFSQTLSVLNTSQCNAVSFTNAENQNFNDNSTTSTAGFFGDFTKAIQGSSQYLQTTQAINSTAYLYTPTYTTTSPTLNLKFDISGNSTLASYTVYYQTAANGTLNFIGTVSSSLQGTQCLQINNFSYRDRFRIVIGFTTGTGANASGTTNFDNFFFTPVISAIVLPVHFSAVSVRKATEGAQVTWTVGTEQNVSGYDVEKSVDGRSFTKIGFVSAAGLSSYSFVDAKAGVVNFYRVKSVDIDGKYGYSTVVSLNNGAASVVVKAFMSDKSTLTVQHDAAQSGSRISVISMDGRVVKVQLPAQGAQQTKVDMSSAQTGLYIIRYDNGQGGSESIKIAK